MKALITGSNGYIGKILSKYIKDNYKDSFLIGVDHNSRKLPNPSLDIQGFYDITEESIIDYLLAYKIDTIFHLAASASVPDSINAPFYFYYNNVGQTTQLLKNLEENEWKGNFIFSSSAGVYDYSYELVSESSPTRSPHPYGNSKLLCEQLMKESILHQNKIKFTAFRFFNVAGAYGNVGDHLDSGHVLQKICHAAITKTPFTVNGHTLTTRDGSCMRDYVHVLDICRAHITAAEKMNWSFATFNLGTSVGVTVIELANKFKEITGEELIINLGPQRAGDPEHLVADSRLFQQCAQFKYHHSTPEEIICSAWKHYKQEFNNAV